MLRTIIVKMFHKALDCDARYSVTESDVKFLSPVARRVVTKIRASWLAAYFYRRALCWRETRLCRKRKMDRERIVGKPEVIQFEPIRNDSFESELVRRRTASAIWVVKKLVTVTAFQKACSVSSVE